jgi:hypothetical protein
MTKRRKLATLTVEENAAWIDYFTFAKHRGYSDLRADAYAWRHTCNDFPRLMVFDGARP